MENELTIREIQKGLKEKWFSAEEIAKAYLARIEEKDGEIKAYLRTDNEGALAAARSVDDAIAAGRELPPLAGVPFALKDNLLIKGQVATAASKMLADYRASYTAHVVEKLSAQHAVILGKTNLDEFAMGTSTENSGFQITRNPRDPSRSPGGSSGGSAAAVAGDMAVAALGSDTGGSIRQPAALCGIVGMKPTYGAVSRSGVIAMASSLDQIGPLTKTVEDAAIVFDAIRGRDPLDATSIDHDYGDEIAKLRPDRAKELTVGVPDEYFTDGVDPEVARAVESAIEELKTLGIKTKRISLPHSKYGLSAYYILCPAEVSSNLARFDGVRYGLKERSVGFGPEVKRRIILGTFVLSSGHHDAYYRKAQQVRALVRRDFDEAFRDVDVIVGPTSPVSAFKIGEKVSDPLSLYLLDMFTIPANLAGIPGMSLPVRGVSGLPVGLQLLARPFREADMFDLGRAYELLSNGS